MIKEKSRKRSTVVRIRFFSNEYETLKELSEEAYTNISDYIRRCVHEHLHAKTQEVVGQDIANNKNRFACDHDREMMCILMREFLFVKELARKGLEPELFEKCNEQALHMLKKWGYEQ